MKLNKLQITNLMMLTGVAAGLTACTTPQKSAQTKRSASFAEARNNPGAHTGAKVVWGGQITSVMKNSNNGSQMLVSEVPLFRLGHEPVYDGKSQGSFIVKTPGALDPNTFQPGEIITLTGKFIGQTNQMGNDWEATINALPIVAVQTQDVRFWQLRARPDLSDGPYYMDDYPFDTREEDIPYGWEHFYVPKTVNQHVPDSAGGTPAAASGTVTGQ